MQHSLVDTLLFNDKFMSINKQQLLGWEEDRPVVGEHKTTLVLGSPDFL